MSLQSVFFFCRGFLCAVEILNTRQRQGEVSLPYIVDIMETLTSSSFHSSSTGRETTTRRTLNYFT